MAKHRTVVNEESNGHHSPVCALHRMIRTLAQGSWMRNRSQISLHGYPQAGCRAAAVSELSATCWLFYPLLSAATRLLVRTCRACVTAYQNCFRVHAWCPHGQGPEQTGRSLRSSKSFLQELWHDVSQGPTSPDMNQSKLAYVICPKRLVCMAERKVVWLRVCCLEGFV